MKPKPSTRAPLAPVPRIHALTGRTLAEVRPRRGETIARFHRRASLIGEMAALPTIVAERVDGEMQPVLKKDWHRRIGARTDLVLFSQPLGPGGSGGVAGIVGLVALMAIAGPAGTAIAGSLFAGSALAASASSALIVGGGSYLLSHFLGAKRGAKSAVPEYSVDIKSNMARSQQPIPVQYGRVKFFPDLAASSWSDYSGTDQVFHALYALGCGKFAVEEIGLGDTPIWTAAGGLRAGYAGSVSLQFMDPDQPCTLFPADVYSSPSVSGQTLLDPYGTTYADGTVNSGSDNETSGVQVLGPFVSNPSGTTTNHIAVDLIAPSGMYVTNAKGNTKPVSVDVRLEVQPIDDQGHALGDWVKVIETPIIRESKQPVRLSLSCDVGAGRYQVRLSRLNAMRQDGGVDTMTWVGLRSYLLGANTVPYASRLAVQMKADRLLSAASSQQLYVIATRHIPVWNGIGMVLAPSRNPVWAALDVWINADYGGNLGYDKVDLPTLVRLAADADARGDAFNYRFTAQTTVLEAIETCLAVILTKPVFLWDQFSMVRDQPRSLPKLQLTDNHILRGSLNLNYTLKDTQTSDGTILEYVDEDTWQQAEVDSRAEGSVLLQPARVQTPGITVRRQGTVVARYLAATNNYRRKGTSFEIEAEGRLLRRGDLVSVQSEMPLSWGQAGRVLDGSVDAEKGVFWLDAPLDWSAGGLTFYARIRRRNGKPWGPVLVSRGGNDAQLVINTQDAARVAQGVDADGLPVGTWVDALSRSGLQYPSSIDFSPGQPSAFLGLVDAISQGSAENTFKIELVNDAPEVYLVDGQSVEPLPTPSSLILPATPAKQLSHVSARLYQEGTSIALTASWDADPGSIRYQAQLSYDGGQSYPYNVYGGDFPFFTVTGLSPNDCKLIIRGVNAAGLVGAWNEVDLTSPALILNPASLGFALSFDDLLPELYANVQMQPLSDLEDLVSVSMESLVGAATQQTILEQQVAQAHAKVEELTYAQALNGQALAGKVLTITAAVNDNAASIKQEIQTRATADSAITSTVTTLNASVSANTAAIVQEAQARADADSATATVITTLTSTVSSNTASITQEAQTRATADSAMATTISNLSATVGSNSSAITNEQQVRASQDSAIAASVTSLSTTVGSNSASISTLQASVNGVLVQYGVVGTIDGQTGGFIFQGVQRLDGSAYFATYFKGDVIVDGTVQASKIVDLSLGGGKIANGAISAFGATSGSLSGGGEDGGAKSLSVSITLDQAAQVLIDFRVQCFNQGSTGVTNVNGVLSADGNVAFNDNIFQFAGGTVTIMASCQTIVSLAAGTHTIRAAASARTSADRGGVTNGYLTVSGFKK